ncbi:MAG: hypothetical protein WBD79_23035, partial [Anaerolineae bacterium]
VGRVAGQTRRSVGSGHGITPDAIAVIYHEWRNQPGFWPRIARIETKSPWNSCKLVKFVAEKAGRILATNDTNRNEKTLEFVSFVADSALQRPHDRAHGGRRGLHPGL